MRNLIKEEGGAQRNRPIYNKTGAWVLQEVAQAATEWANELASLHVYNKKSKNQSGKG